MIRNNAQFCAAYEQGFYMMGDTKKTLPKRFDVKDLVIAHVQYGELEQYLDLTDETKIPVATAAKTIPFLQINKELGWFRILESKCEFESATMGHCGGQHEYKKGQANLFSLRSKTPVGWRPRVTATWLKLWGDKGVLIQVKGPKNSIPKDEWTHAIYALMTMPQILYYDRNHPLGYLAENDFDPKKLSNKQIEQLKKIKGYDMFQPKNWLKNLNDVDLVAFMSQWAPKQEGDTPQIVMEGDLVTFCRQPDFDSFVIEARKYLDKSVHEKMRKQKDWAEEWSDYDVRTSDDEAMESGILEKVKELNEPLYKKIKKKIDAGDEEIMDILKSAFARGMESGYNDDKRIAVERYFDSYDFKTPDADVGATSLKHTETKDGKYIEMWYFAIHKNMIPPLYEKYAEQHREDNFLDFLVSSPSTTYQNNDYFHIEVEGGSFNLDWAVELFLEDLAELWDKPSK
jgi:hypothetical protein